MASAALLSVLGAFASGCGGSATAPQVPDAPQTLRAEPHTEGFDAPRASTVATLSDGHTGSQLLYDGRNAIAFYADGGALYAQGLEAGSEGLAPAGARTLVGPIGFAAGATLFAATRFDAGYLVTWAEPAGAGSKVWSAQLTERGALVAEPVVLTHLAAPLMWVEPVAHDAGALVILEVDRPPGTALLGIALGRGGAGSGAPPTLLAEGVAGWSPVAAGRTTALGWVSVPTGPEGYGQAQVAFIDGLGRTERTAALTDAPSALADLQLAEIDGRIVAAWTDARALDVGVWRSVLSMDGAVVVPPQRASPPFGDHALVGLVGDGRLRGLLAWEPLEVTPGGERWVSVGTINRDGVLDATTSRLAFTGLGAPTFTPAGDGFAALTLAEPRLSDAYELEEANAEGAQEEEGPTIETSSIWPFVVQLSPELEVRGAEPVRLEQLAAQDGIPDETHNLSCTPDGCFLLASSPRSNSPLLGARLLPRDSPWNAPVARDGAAAPHAIELSTWAQSPYVEDVAYISEELPLMWLESAGPDATADGLFQGRVLARAANGAPVVVAEQASVMGGIAMARRPGGGAVAAWVGLSRDEPQLRAAWIAQDGTVQHSQWITSAGRGDQGAIGPYGVHLAPAKEGIAVLWIDDRSGDAEVYAARINRSLEKLEGDIRLTDAAGSASGVHAVHDGDDIAIVWSDARGDPVSGIGDLYFMRLDALTMRPRDRDVRLFASEHHATSARIEKRGEGYVVLWVEEDLRTGDAPTRGAYRLSLDSAGRVIEAPHAWLADQSATALDVHCDGSCRAVALVNTPAAGTLAVGTTLDGSTPLPVLPSGSLGAAHQVELVGDGSRAVLADYAQSRGRLRHLRIQWTP